MPSVGWWWRSNQCTSTTHPRWIMIQSRTTLPKKTNIFCMGIMHGPIKYNRKCSGNSSSERVRSRVCTAARRGRQRLFKMKLSWLSWGGNQLSVSWSRLSVTAKAGSTTAGLTLWPDRISHSAWCWLRF